VDQPDAPNRGTEDAITLGAGDRSPRWARLGAVLAALLVGLGSYQLLARPSTSAEPPSAEGAGGAEARSGAALSTGLAEGRDAADGTTVRVGGHRMTLSGPAVTQAHRETSAAVVGPLGHSWIVKLTSTACEGPADPRVTYGVAAPTGRFTSWRAVGPRRPATAWNSPNGNLRLVHDGSHLKVRVTSTGKVLARYPTDR
jgi:hypothetical protein